MKMSFIVICLKLIRDGKNSKIIVRMRRVVIVMSRFFFIEMRRRRKILGEKMRIVGRIHKVPKTKISSKE